MSKENPTELKGRREWIQVEITQLQCPECTEWFTPKAQPPRANTASCTKSKCRVAVFRKTHPEYVAPQRAAAAERKAAG